ncbi:MAG: thiamine pyrophosphate-dependent enzyme [Nannocystaceae bacterium]
MSTALENPPPLPLTLVRATSEDTESAYREMLRIRRFEEAAARAYTQGRISGFLHLYIGQEAIAVGTAAALRFGDRVVTTYRDHGFALAMGSDAGQCMAELYGKATGLVGGVGGSMHYFDRAKGLWGGYAIVGNHLPIAAGHAFAARYKNEDIVTLVFMGDGAVGIGPAHEAMTLAGLWKLPIVFVVENNRYSMGTPLSRTLPVEDITARGPGYGIATDRFAVTDNFQVQDRLGAAIDRARRGEGATLVELLTYRFRGHSMSDPAKYRGPGELDSFRQLDPLEAARCALLNNHGLTEAQLDTLDDEVSDEMAEASAFAERSPVPDPSHRFRNVYVEE